MDHTRFPKETPGILGNKSFLHVFEQIPEIVEFVDQLWLADKTTGLFKLFFVYIKQKLENALLRKEHEDRCVRFVDGKKDVANYMVKYKKT